MHRISCVVQCGILTCFLLSFASLRLFLRKLKLTLKIPVLALVDSDPYGLKILSVYMKGEDTLAAHACWFLYVPDRPGCMSNKQAASLVI